MKTFLQWLGGDASPSRPVDISAVPKSFPSPQAQGAAVDPENAPANKPNVTLPLHSVVGTSAPAPSSAAAPPPTAAAASMGKVEALLKKGLNALAALPPDERGTSLVINDIGELLRDVGRMEEAKQLFEEALAARRQRLGGSDGKTLTSLNSLGLLLREMGDLSAARPLLTEALASRRQTQGDAHPETLTAMNNLGALLKAMGDLDGAEALYAEALEGRKAVLGASHPDTLTSINNLASLYRSQGRLYEAEPLLAEAAATARTVLGDSHPHTKIFEKGLSAVQTQTQTHRAREQRGLQSFRARPQAGPQASHHIYTAPTQMEGPPPSRRQQLKPR